MSISCAECDKIFKFGNDLYVASLVSLTKDGAELPQEGGPHIPNALICPSCLDKVPKHAHHEQASNAREPHGSTAFAYSPVITAKCEYAAYGPIPVTGEFKYIKYHVFGRRLPKALKQAIDMRDGFA